MVLGPEWCFNAGACGMMQNHKKLFQTSGSTTSGLCSALVLNIKKKEQADISFKLNVGKVILKYQRCNLQVSKNCCRFIVKVQWCIFHCRKTHCLCHIRKHDYHGVLQRRKWPTPIKQRLVVLQCAPNFCKQGFKFSVNGKSSIL
jgi:hypothetical protein